MPDQQPDGEAAQSTNGSAASRSKSETTTPGSSRNAGSAISAATSTGTGLGPVRSPDEVQPDTGSRFRLRNWRLRSKLALVLVIPILTALVLGTLRAVDEQQQAQEFQQTANQVDFANKVTAVVQELQTERSLMVARIASGDATRQAPLDAQIAKVDLAVQDVRNAAGELDTEDSATRERYNRGLERINALRPLRAAIAASPFSDLSALNTYSAVLESLVQLGREVSTAVTDRDLLRQGSTIQAISEAKEFSSRGDAALQIAALRNTFFSDLLTQVRDSQASATAATDTFTANATPEQQQYYSDTLAGPELDDRARLRTQAVAKADAGQAPGLDSNRLSTDSVAFTERLRSVENSLLGNLKTRADDLASSASTAAYRDAAIVAIALLATLVLTLVVARMLLRPLRQLRRSALEAASGLPGTVQSILDAPDPIAASRQAVDPIPVTSRDEIGEVARSFDTVHERAVRMAAEQALLRENVNGIFVNLSRRSQRLVERQLGVIDRLEADEQDPDQLASLFELDHLATRLRRNGESLLVLSGAGLAKSVPRPVPAADVIGAAVSEIEQYARVEVPIVPEVAVQGRTIHDLVHVLAELLDNATYFSEPETKVTVRAVVTRKKALAIQITDRGVGMSEAQVTEANQRLADPPDLDVSVTRRMGLYVVARLAKRHGIEVRLRENEDIEGGVVARIVVPADLLTAIRPDPQRVAASRSERSQPSMPAISPVPERSEPRTPPPPPSPAPAGATDGLVALDQPISLDSLVAGSSSAAFLSTSPPETDAPTVYHNGNGSTGSTGSGGSNGSAAEQTYPGQGYSHEPSRSEHTARIEGNGRPQPPPAEPAPEEVQRLTPLNLPKREPKYVPITPEEPRSEAQQAESDAAALEDDVPTRRLPIYQSVLSRWFNDEDAAAQQQGDAPPADGAPGPQQPRSQDEEVAAQIWRSESDDGWRAAHALLDSKDEELTQAGLPKRVPNAYLVPGSVGRSGDSDAFGDSTAAKANPGQIARSATAARSRMASFQRGYTTGRHALKEPAETQEQDGVSVSGGGRRSLPEDSSEE